MDKPILIEEPDAQEVYYDICCGIDVHQKAVVACLLRPNKKKEIRKYGTNTKQLKELAQWLSDEHCEMIAMESTGIYWRPLYNIFEEYQLKAMLVNAAHMRNVPGHKSDIGDAQWIARLLKQGLLKANYIPSREQRELRDLTRYRKSLVEEKSREVNRLQKLLESANIKLGTQLSDINGKTGRWLLECKLSKEVPEEKELQEKLPTKKMKERVEEIAQSLEGELSEAQEILIRQILKRIDAADEDIEQLSAAIEKLTAKDAAMKEALTEIPGIGKTSAEIILAEIGTDMEPFATSDQLTAWAGVSPTKNESAGKKKPSRQEKGTNC